MKTDRYIIFHPHRLTLLISGVPTGHGTDYTLCLCIKGRINRMNHSDVRNSSIPFYDKLHDNSSLQSSFPTDIRIPYVLTLESDQGIDTSWIGRHLITVIINPVLPCCRLNLFIFSRETRISHSISPSSCY